MTFAEAKELLERYVAGDELTVWEEVNAFVAWSVIPGKDREEMLDRWEAQHGRRKEPLPR